MKLYLKKTIEPDYIDLIMRWFERSQQEEEVFAKFIFLYISFNAFINQTRETSRERQKITYLKNNDAAKNFYLRLIQNDVQLKKTINKIKSYLDNKPLESSTEGHLSNEWDGKLRGEDDWENLVEYWYRVRNNLFHGHSVPDFDRHVFLVEMAFITLTPLMKNFVDHDLAWNFS